ncbi:xylulokinase [Salipaludibacillus sp. CF4.18]|uniref:xylulokinase n=1 Tax=Salipaludibacillus sp. CF4.18 TaxID=3373081 RepID=UPI003EE6E354
MSHVIGIDIGTSGIKVGAMDKKGELDFICYSPYSLLYPKKEQIEIDVNQVWEKTKVLLLEVFKKVSKQGSVDAISLSTFCNTSVFLDEEGNALGNGIMYLDQRSKKEAELIRDLVGDEKLQKITKNRLEPGMFSVTTLLWSKNNEINLYNKTYKWGNLSTFILSKLTGEFVMDWTQASFSGIFDMVEYNWSKELCEIIGIDQSILPKVVDPLEVIGFSDIFSDVNLMKEIPVIAGGADTACSTLALGIKPNELFESIGTSNVLTVCTDNSTNMDIRFLNRCHIIKGQWLSHGAMSTPGAAVKWYSNTFLSEKDILEETAKQSPIGSNGVFFLPYMQGERSPIWDPNARGVYVGLHLNTTKEDMFRGILEGCAFGLRQIYEIIQSEYRTDFRNIQAIGGGSKNRVWAQIKANVLNETIEIKSISETGVYGACLVASVAVSYFNSFEDAQCQIKNETVDIITPQKESVLRYNELYHLFNELYPLLKTFFKKANY